jgi:hypothetical protein
VGASLGLKAQGSTDDRASCPADTTTLDASIATSTITIR